MLPERAALVKTTTGVAPWNLIEGNDKYWERVRVLQAGEDTFSRIAIRAPRSIEDEDQIKEDQAALMST